ncbi:hypothetical protein GCM10023147_13980 [Tsukamurella soli]|uniref:Uncharacterized protein n=1 Tax=Tsukamurella soli TaxID=644556 RepID=A0ABP8JBW1_9ACTN
MVGGNAYVRLSSVGSGGQPLAPAPARATKYMAKSPAKNMSSLDNQTIVPTLTMLGRFSECTRWVIPVAEVGAALVTRQV